MGYKYKKIIASISLILLSACDILSDTNFPVNMDSQSKITNDEVNIIKLNANNIDKFKLTKQKNKSKATPEMPSWKYNVGIGDVLSINVWDHPELNLSGISKNGETSSGFIVNANGEIFYPYIKKIKVLGLSAPLIQEVITTRLKKYISDPQVDVKIIGFNSQKIQITGSINTPQSVSISNIPLSLLDAVNKAGGLLPDANSREVTIQRKNNSFEIDLNSFLSNGNISGNPTLKNNDIVNIPKQQKSLAFIMGEISQPGTIELNHERINLTEAINLKGGIDKNTANAQGIFVFREDPNTKRFNVFQLDASTPLAFVLATKFYLHPQDVVYVVRDPISRWNALINSLIPSVTSVRTIQQNVGGL